MPCCLKPDADVLIDAARLHPGEAFNPSLIEHRGKLLMPYRVGPGGSTLHVAELGPDLQPVRTVPVRPRHRLCAGGCEDPRAFVWRGRLHLSFTGVELVPVGKVTPGRDYAWPLTVRGGDVLRVRTHVLFCRLDDGLKAEETLAPACPGRNEWWEKNWGFFEATGELLCVYRPGPRHDVRHVAGGRELVPLEATPAPAWPETHGGPAPVPHGGLLWAFPHDTSYRTYCHAFDPKPPFRVQSYLPKPLMEPRPLPGHPKGHVQFAAGAVFRDGKLLLAYGEHDARCRIATFDAAALEKAMVPL